MKTGVKSEILAPAGSIEQLVAAVNNGCNSVYLGLDSFNARMKAPNFTAENISEWIDYCHLYGVKVYVAINTSIKNDEFAKAVDLLKTVYLNNADGVIITDLALMRIASQLPKPFDVVASTQLNAHDSFGADFLRKCGATTVVCARESSIQEIKDVASTGVNVECFIHGATCVCQSGQCLFSSVVGGNSGNRGLCAQPCRKLYSANDGQSWGYLLSARDLCGLDIACQLHESGVSTYKIEGRNRRAEYAGITSRIYKQLFGNQFQYDKSDTDALAEMYNRSMSPLSYLKGENNDIIEPHVQNHVGVSIGTVSGKGFIAQTQVTKGDGLKVFDGNKEICGGVALESGTDGYISAEFSDNVRNGMEVRRTTSVKLCDDVLTAKKLLPLSVKLIAYPDSYAELSAQCNGVSVNIKSDFTVQKALNKPTSDDEIAEQLQKTGNSHYTITDITIEKGEIFLAKSQINSLRRQLLEVMDKAIIEQYDCQFSNRVGASSVFDGITASLSEIKLVNNRQVGTTWTENKSFRSNILAVTCYTKAQLQEMYGKAQYLIYKPQFINAETVGEARAYNAYVDLPSFSDNHYLRKLLLDAKAGVVCHNVGHVELARKLSLPYIGGSGLNIYNDYIANEFSDAETFVYSQELTLGEISQFTNRNGLVFVDGNVTLMKLVHCPYKLNYNCDCTSCKAFERLTYKDELGNCFDVVRRRDSRCTFELLNGKKLSAVSKLKRGGRYLVDYNPQIVNHYLALNNGVDDGYSETAPYTKGRLFNKVN